MKTQDTQFMRTFIKRFSIIIGIKIVIILFFFLYSAEKTKEFQEFQNQQTPQICFKEHCILLELAVTPEERELGLMFRENLEENKGMLFVFPEEKSHNFWMRNTLIPLDIIHIDSNHKVVDIISAPPCEEENCPIYKSEQQSQRSLEINSGYAAKLGIQIGDLVEFKGL